MTRKEVAVAAPMEAQVIGYERIAVNLGLADTANFCERERAPDGRHRQPLISEMEKSLRRIIERDGEFVVPKHSVLFVAEK